MTTPKLIGLSGTNGSGKDTVGHMLAQRHNYLFISVSDLLRDEARDRNLPVTREVLRTISAEWRREFGLGVLVDRAVERYGQAGDRYAGLVACPMRNAGEAQHLKDLGGLLVWVDADPRVRYERIQANAANRGRAGEDDKTFEQFLREEEAEMHKPVDGDDATLNMLAVKEKANLTISNSTANIAEFEDIAEKALGF